MRECRMSKTECRSSNDEGRSHHQGTVGTSPHDSYDFPQIQKTRRFLFRFSQSVGFLNLRDQRDFH